MLGRLKRDIEAEGEIIRKGEIVEIEKIYADSVDVYHFQTGTLFWVRESDIEPVL